MDHLSLLLFWINISLFIFALLGAFFAYIKKLLPKITPGLGGGSPNGGSPNSGKPNGGEPSIIDDGTSKKKT
jgi:hypothetical protein